MNAIYFAHAKQSAKQFFGEPVPLKLATIWHSTPYDTITPMRQPELIRKHK